MAYSYKGSISFGLVYIPVTLHSTIKENDIGFNMIDKKTMSRVKYKKTCADCEGREVRQEDIVAYVEPKSVTLQNKRFKDLTDIYPELSDICKCVKKRVILDGELVVLTDGKPDFYALQKRSLMGDKFRISLTAKKNPVQFVAYDILYFDSKDLTEKPLMERKEILSKAVTEGHNLSVSRWIEKKGVAFAVLKSLLSESKEEQGKMEFDFNKIKPMPEELNIQASRVAKNSARLFLNSMEAFSDEHIKYGSGEKHEDHSRSAFETYFRLWGGEDEFTYDEEEGTYKPVKAESEME